MGSTLLIDQEGVAAFFDVVNATCQDELGNQIVSALKRRLEKPPTELISTVLHKALGDAEVRPRSHHATSRHLRHHSTTQLVVSNVNPAYNCLRYTTAISCMGACDLPKLSKQLPHT